jgi:hypothetical protein
MSKVIDLELDLPFTSEEQIAAGMKQAMLTRGDKGVANYLNIFGPRRARALGLTLEDLERMWDELSPEEFESRVKEKAKGLAVSLPEFVEQLDEAGVEWGVIQAGTNDRTAEIVSQFPDKLIGQATSRWMSGGLSTSMRWPGTSPR